MVRWKTEGPLGTNCLALLSFPSTPSLQFGHCVVDTLLSGSPFLFLVFDLQPPSGAKTSLEIRSKMASAVGTTGHHRAMGPGQQRRPLPLQFTVLKRGDKSIVICRQQDRVPREAKGHVKETMKTHEIIQKHRSGHPTDTITSLDINKAQ